MVMIRFFCFRGSGSSRAVTGGHALIIYYSLYRNSQEHDNQEV